MKALKRIGFFALLALAPALMAPTGGLPSRPKFQAVGINTPPLAAAGSLAVANQGVFSLAAVTNTYPISISSSLPGIWVNESDQAADNRAWNFLADGKQLRIQAVNDAGTVADNIIIASRGSGTVISQIDIGSASNPIIAGNGVPMTPTTGTFTATLNGVGTTVQGTASYYTIGKMVMIVIPALTGSSNTTSMSITGIPSALWPVSTQQMAFTSTLLVDNGALCSTCNGEISSGGTMNFYKGTSLTGFTNGGGLKGLNAGTKAVFTYSLL